MPWANELLCVPILVAGFACPVYAQSESCLRRTVPLNVHDAQGRTIHGLSPSDFEAKYHGQPVKILSLVPDDRPHRVVILLDASGRMAHVWKPAITAASDVAETQLPNLQVALIIFGEKVTEMVDFSRGKRLVAERLRQIGSDIKYSTKSVHGGTALHDSMLAGLQILGSTSSADSLYLVSDGDGDNVRHTRFEDTARQLTSSRTRLFVVAVFDPQVHRNYRNRNADELNGRRDLEDLVKRTGGEIIAPYSHGIPTTTNEAERIANAMNAFYLRITRNDLLELELPEPLDKPGDWELRVSPEKKKQLKGAEISYPSSLSPCEP